MRRSWCRITAPLSTPLGRFELLHGLYQSAWPLLSRCASLYRRTLARNTRIVAVVGSFGKSTTTRAVHTALGGQPHACSLWNSWSFVARAVLRIRPYDRHAVIEVGIRAPGQMAAYARLLRPDVVVVTSIGSEHNRSLKTLETTRAEKAEMVRALPTSGVAVLNGDDPNVLWMKGQTRARVITFGVDQANDVRASNIALDWPHGTRFTLHAGGGTREVRIRLVGKPMVYPVLAAAAVALVEGVPLDQVVPTLEALPPTPGRLEPIRLTNGAIILRDDHKSGLETIEAALEVISEIPAQQRIVVFGEVSEPPGSQGPIYRRLGGSVAQAASCAIFIGGSSWKSFVAGAKRGGLPRESISKAKNVFTAIELLREGLKPGDVVLIKGRDTQRLDRISLALMGRTVRCGIDFCNMKLRCEHCRMLEQDWKG